MQRQQINKYTRAVSRQRLGKYVPAATDMHITIQALFEWVFSTRSLQRVVKRISDAKKSFEFVIYSTRVEAGSNTSTATLRVVGGDEKGRLKSETVKYGGEYNGIWTRE
jgi:2'-5' RNA ligase